MPKVQLSRTKPYTATDAAILYQKNAGFRKLSNHVLELLSNPAYKGSGKATATVEGQQVAIATASASTAIGDKVYADVKSARYVHPAQILYWAVALITKDSPTGAGAFSRGVSAGITLEANPVELAALVQEFKLPNLAARKWEEIIRKANITNEPHWHVAEVEPMRGPSKGMVGGYPLRTLTVRVPIGSQFYKDGNGVQRAGARAFREITLDLKSPSVQARFGQVWICYTSDRKSAYLASEKGGTSLSVDDFAAFIKEGSARDTGINNAVMKTLDKPRYSGIASKEPQGLANTISSMAAKQVTGSVVGVDG